MIVRTVCVRDGVILAPRSPAVIPWLNDRQREHFLRNNLISEIADTELGEPRTTDAIAAPQVNPDIVDDCIDDLDRLKVAPDAGAPTARTALREGGMRYSNDAIAAAVRARKGRVAAAVPDRPDS